MLSFRSACVMGKVCSFFLFSSVGRIMAKVISVTKPYHVIFLRSFLWPFMKFSNCYVYL